MLCFNLSILPGDLMPRVDDCCVILGQSHRAEYISYATWGFSSHTLNVSEKKKGIIHEISSGLHDPLSALKRSSIAG